MGHRFDGLVSWIAVLSASHIMSITVIRSMRVSGFVRLALLLITGSVFGLAARARELTLLAVPNRNHRRLGSQ